MRELAARHGHQYLVVVAVIAVLLFGPCTVPVASGQKEARKRAVSISETSKPRSDQRRGSYYALVIGIDNYVRPFTRLRTPVNDARAIAALLHSQYGFETRLLTNATRDQILAALFDFRARLREQDSLIIYYAGHGRYDREADEAYWLPIDAEERNSSRWINAAEVTGQARAMSARHVLIVSDSCYAGMFTREVNPTLADPRERDVYLDKMLHGKSRYVLASGGNEPVADSDTSGHSPDHSVFANALLQGLLEFHENAFSAEELFSRYLVEQVSGRSDQGPKYSPIRNSGHDGGAFVFVRTRSLVATSMPVGHLENNPRREQIPPPAAEDPLTETLHRYEEAYQSMDIGLLKKVWPSLSRAQINALRAGFAGSQAVKVNLENCNGGYRPNETTQQLSCDQSMVYTRAGKRQPPEVHRVDIQLAQAATGEWLVNDVRPRR